MSGVDESRPVCDVCELETKEGLDNRRLIGRNSDGLNIVTISSLWQESKTGIRIQKHMRSDSANKVLAIVYCGNCGRNHREPDFVFSVKKYVYKYGKPFGTTTLEFNDRLNKVLHGPTGVRLPSVPVYDEYLGEDPNDYCGDCGNHVDDCTCNSYCSECDNNPCVCCDNCGCDSRTCNCYCTECWLLRESCDC